MNATVEMFRDATEAGGRDRFSCSLFAWNLLQQIATEFDWAPQGSSYVAHPGTKFVTPVERDYQPGDAKDPKRVSAEDAMGWAHALERALVSPLLSEILAARDPCGVPHETIISVLKEFTEYCYGGAFVFATR